MKKLASITMVAMFATLALTSCKKEHTCTCTDANGAKTATTIPKSSKDDAETSCDALSTAQFAFDGGSCSLD